MRRWAAVLMLFLLGVSCGGEDARRDAAAAVGLSGVVCGVPMRAGAVVIDEGLVLTAAHPVAGADGVIDVVTGAGATREGTVVGFDAARDLALIAVPTSGAAPERASSIAAGGQGFIVVMAPDATSTRVAFTVLRSITATGEDIYGEGEVERRALELSADVSPGASGAPAFDTEGRLVGIVFAESRSRGVTYAVDMVEVDAFLEETDSSRPTSAGRCP